MSTDKATFPADISLTENLLLIESNGRILSRRVSQIYGRAILGAMAQPLNSIPFKSLHESSLPQHISWTLDNIKKAAQAKAPRVNLMFINDSRKILSCWINPHHGIALFNTLQQTPEGGSHVLSHLQADRISNEHEMVMDASQHAHVGLHQPHASDPSSSLSISGMPAHIMAILPDEILSSANRQSYDRDWMDRYNVNEDCLDGYPSKHKLDVLLRYGAVKVGDRLSVAYHPDSGPVDLVGEVLQSPKKGRLDLRIASADANFDGILHDCKSPKDIIKGMDKVYQLERNSKTSDAWKTVKVVAGEGQEIGSLWKVRQAYQVFTEEMAEWGNRNRQSSS